MRNSLVVLALGLLVGPWAQGSKNQEKLVEKMDEIISPLESYSGWKNLAKLSPKTLVKLSAKNPGPVISVEEREVELDGKTYTIGFGIHSVFIAAGPKTVVQILTEPRYFHKLFDLDKAADQFPDRKKNSFRARIYKLVPGIETQDYVLSYRGKWKGTRWIQRARQLRDESGFALRDNIKIIEPVKGGSIHREVSIIYPLRWWARLFNGVMQKVTRRELAKVSGAIKCVAERVGPQTPMSDSLAESCQKVVYGN